MSASQVCKGLGAFVIMDLCCAIAVRDDAFNTSHGNCTKSHYYTQHNSLGLEFT